MRIAAVVIVLLASLAPGLAPPAALQPVTPAMAQGAAGECGKQEFEAVVEGAAKALRDLHQRNTPGFQDKLRLLRERKKWSPEEFMEKAAPFVQDDEIAAFDQQSNDLLTKLNTMGEAGAASNTPNCKLLGELKATMKALIDTQIQKWAHMFAKIERGLVN